MKGTTELLDVPVREQQLAAAMRAGIVERADRTVGLRATSSDRPTTSYTMVSPGLRQFLFAAGHLPYARPHPLCFEIEERLRGVARRIEWCVAEITPRALAQDCGTARLSWAR